MPHPTRKQTRLPDYDYSSPGTYFITICTENRRCLLSDVVVGALHEAPAVSVHLTEAGRCVAQLVESLNQRYPNLFVDKYVIMPNHIHLLLRIKAGRALREAPLRADEERSLLSKAVGYLKMNSSKQIHAKYPNLAVWQRSYHDHVIRRESDYREIWTYIDENPARWAKDCYYGT